MTDLKRKRGDTYAVAIKLQNFRGEPIDITGYTFKLTVDPERDPVDATNNLFTLNGVITDAAAGEVEFYPTDVQADQTPGTYYYDIEMQDAASRKRTIKEGTFTFEMDITK